MAKQFKVERGCLMNVQQLYKESIGRVREQKKRQERERMEQLRCQIREEQRGIYEKKLSEQRVAQEAGNRELRLIQEELGRTLDQALLLQKRLEELID